MDMANIDHLRKLASYYKEVLSFLSSKAGRHLVDLGSVLPHGLTVDLGTYLSQHEQVLTKNLIQFPIQRLSPEAIATVSEDNGEDQYSEETRPPEESSTEELLIEEQQASTARLISIYRKQEQDPYNRETVLGYPLVAGSFGPIRYCAPLLYFTVHVQHDPIESRFSIQKTHEIPTINYYLFTRLVDQENEAALLREKLRPYQQLDHPRFDDSGFDWVAVQEIIQIIAELVPGLRGLRQHHGTQSLSTALHARTQEGAWFIRGAVLVNARRSNAILQDDLTALSSIDTLKGTTVIEKFVGPAPEPGGDFGEAGPFNHHTPLLFPLISNQAQRDVAKKAEQSRLLVVQGPPGTGKSQTIANLVCHLVAQGKTVLMTSHQNKALEVLTDMLPPIEYLALSFLKGERSSLRQLSNQLDHFSAVVEGKSLPTLQQHLNRSLEGIKEAEQKISRLESRFSELKVLERDRCGPFRKYHEIRDYDGIDPHDDVPAGQEELIANALGEWFKLRRAIHDQMADFQRIFGPLGSDHNAVATAIMKIGELVQLFEETLNLLHHQDDARLVRSFASTNEPIDEWEKILPSWISWLETYGNQVGNVLHDLDRGGCLDSQNFQVISSLARSLGEEAASALEDLGASLPNLPAKIIQEGPPPSDLPVPQKPEVSELRHAIATLEKCSQSWWAWYLNNHCRKAKQIVQKNGLGTISFTNRQSRVESLEKWIRYWGLYFKFLDSIEHLRNTGLPLSESPQHLVISDMVHRAHEARNWTQLLFHLSKMPQNLPQSEFQWAINREVERLRKVDDLKRLTSELKALISHIKRIHSLSHLQLNGTTPPYSTQEWGRIAHTIQNLPETAQPIEDARRLQDLLDRKSTYKRLIQLEGGVLITLSKTIKKLHEKLTRNQTIGWIDHPDLAVAVHRLSAFIQTDLISNPDDIGEVATAIRKGREQKQHLIEKTLNLVRQVALKKAEQDAGSYHQIVKMRQLLKKKQKTPSFVHLRNQIDYDGLLKIFPLWILSIEDVARVFPLQEGLFDYLIVDEASQCNQATALHLAYRAKRMVVVGDRHQLKNPQVRFLSQDLVRTLLRRHALLDHPKALFLDARESLLSLAEASADTSPGFLNEHFRCEPLIISWSNREFYGERLRILTPIRLIRFTPTIEVRLVPGANDDPDSKQNLLEADAVIQEIKMLVECDETRELTIGVISPFREQANLLNRNIYESFIETPEYIKKHRLIASTADGFQGDERDIILYSFRFGANTSPGTIRSIELEPERLNVAFSRARRKVICFVSFSPEHFPGRYIRSYLSHALQVQHNPTDRLDGPFEDQFDSAFEQSVCHALRARGFKVRTQVPSGPFRIDLVVSDAEGRRLAVECDGDFHYEEDGDLRPEDYQRQDIIERSGWTVHRIPARRFYWNSNQAIDRVVKELAQQPSEMIQLEAEILHAADDKDEMVSSSIESDENPPEENQTLDQLAKDASTIEGQTSFHHSVVLEPLGQGPISKPECWQQLGQWARATGRLTHRNIRISHDIGMKLAGASRLSDEEMSIAKAIWNSAKAQGFECQIERNL